MSRAVQWLGAMIAKTLAAENSRFPVVALVSSAEDRQTLRTVSTQQSFDLHFAESSAVARMVANGLSAPVILVDRGWPEPE
jgi:hypothetical protein